LPSNDVNGTLDKLRKRSLKQKHQVAYRRKPKLTSDVVQLIPNKVNSNIAKMDIRISQGSAETLFNP